MPKNVGLGLAVRNLVRSKEIITMLNRNGHCINYWECEEIDTTRATSIKETFKNEGGYYTAVVPSNIVPGEFVQSAADNADFLQDTKSGRDSVHVMSIAYYQLGYVLQPELLMRRPPNALSIRRRALEGTDTKLIEFNLGKVKARPTIVQKVSSKAFQHYTVEREALHGIDMAWIFVRNMPTKFLEGTLVSEKQERERHGVHLPEVLG